MVLQSSYCTSTLIVGKFGIGADDNWFDNSEKGSDIAGGADAASLRMLAMVVFCGASAGEDVVSTGGIMISN